jgi:RNA polymerase sigma-70 factor (ECF subfamily)
MTQTRTSLLRRVRNPADGASWAEFVALYEPLLLNYVRKRGLNEHDARDVVQTIFVNLLRKMPNFELDKSRGRFRTWLWRVCHHAVVDHGRARQRIQKAEIARRQNFTEAEPEPEDWIAMHRQRTLQFAMERVRAVTAPKTWACFEQHVLRNRPGADVGAEVGLPANSVYVNASRVVERIRDECAAYREDLGDD